MSTGTEPEGRGRRSGGRAARVAARSQAVGRAVPFITRTLAPVETVSEEGIGLIERNADRILEEAGIEFRDPDALATLKAAGADVDGELVRFPDGMARAVVQATAPREFTQFARNPANDVRFGGMHTILRARVRFALRPRPGPGAALRDDRGLPELREADVRLAVPAPQRRHRLRARRPAGEQAASRHGLRAPAVLGQAVHGLGHASRSRARHRGDGADPVRRGAPRGPPRDPQPDQRELALGVGRHDAGRREGVTRRRTRRC